MSHRFDLVRARLAVAFALSVLPALLPGGIAAQTPVASPQAVTLPQGPLGEQVRWLLDLLNGPPEEVTVEEVEAHLAPEFLSQVPAGEVAETTAQLGQALGPLTIEEDSIVTTRDLPPTNGRLVLVGAGGVRIDVAIAVDRESGLITGLLLTPAMAATPEAAPVATPAVASGVSVVDEEVTFQSGPDTIHGSLLVPDSAAAPAPGALIVSGSGPTDRNGNSPPLTTMNTNLNLATTLAAEGVVSLRYDKLGSGETGLGSRSASASVGVDVFTQQARDALAFLAARPEVDPEQLILVGHSEGALFALLLAQEMTAGGVPPAAVILAAPLSVRYLDIIDEQVTAQLDAARAAGQLSTDEAEAARMELSAIITALRETGEMPGPVTTPGLDVLFNPASIEFLAGIDAIDPADVAAGLPASLPVLVLHGEKDEQVTLDQVEWLMTGFAEAGNGDAKLVVLPNANHLLKTVEGAPNLAVDYANPELPFSSEAIAAIERFLATHGLARE